MSVALAVLVDAENIPPSTFSSLNTHVKRLGSPIVWQLFGDFVTCPLPGWQDIAEREGFDIRHQFRGGKNAADIAMTVSAMDLLHKGKVEGFCLASSDRDFAALARRLRADNLPVHGFGEAKTAASFRKACTSFHVLHVPNAPTPALPWTKAGSVPSDAARDRGIDQPDVQRLHELLHAVCREKGTEGRVLPQTAAAYLKAEAPDLAERIGGTGKFLKSLKAMDLVDVHEMGTQRLISVRFVRPVAVR